MLGADGGSLVVSFCFLIYRLYMVFILFLLMYSMHMVRVVIDIAEPM